MRQLLIVIIVGITLTVYSIARIIDPVCARIYRSASCSKIDIMSNNW